MPPEDDQMPTAHNASARDRQQIVRPLRRSEDDCLLGGVCGGIARRLGLRPRSLRIAAVLAVLVFGAGLVAYMVLWTITIRHGESSSIATRTLKDRRELQIVLAVSTVVLAILIALQALELANIGGFAWPLGLSALGAMVVWRGASPQERVRLQELVNASPLAGIATNKSWKAVACRATAGIVLVLVGVGLLSSNGNQSRAAFGALIGAVILGAGFFTLFAPWWLRTVRDLTNERRERVRAQERADMAAHLHDSVLQTLSLIQRSAHDPVEVTRLARIQERDLRSWLFKPAAFWARSDAPTTLVQAASDIERDVEDTYGVSVEMVVVGDCALDESTSALLAAGREATVNAAKWSGAPTISVFVEAEPDLISMFVRDLGGGFDPDAVPADRHGIARSIVERMQRVGGNGNVRSSPGSGAEVTLTLPRHSQQP
jgi:signal transduction histidine kinase